MSTPAPSLALAERNCAEAHARYQERVSLERTLDHGSNNGIWSSIRPNAGYTLPPENIDFPWAFKLIPTINFAVSLYQNLLSAVPLRFYTTSARGEKTELERRPGNIVDVWSMANSEETGLANLKNLIGSMRTQGIAYLNKEMFGTNRVQELWVLDPRVVVVVPFEGNARKVKHYEIGTGKDKRIVPRQQITRFPLYDPFFGLVGLSPLASLQLHYETQRDAMRMTRSFYQHGGMVAGHYSTEFALDPDDKKVLEDELSTRHRGPLRAWEPVLLPRSLKYERSGLDFQEMQFIENHQISDEMILRVNMIPPMCAGKVEGGGLNSDVAAVTDRQLYAYGIEPFSRDIQAIMNENFLPLVALGVTCEFDFTDVAAYQRAWLETAAAYQTATGGPFLLREEARVRLKLEDLKDPNLAQMLVPMAMLTDDEKEANAELAAKAPAPKDAPGSEERRSHLETRDTKRRDRLRVRADRSRRPHERRMERGFRRLFARQRARAKAELEAQTSRGAEAEGLQHGGSQRSDEVGWGPGLDHLRAIDIDALLQDEDADRTLIERLIRAIVAEQGQQALADIGLAIAFDSARKDVREWIAEKALRSLTNVNDTTREALRAALVENVSGGETYGDLVARLDEVFDARRARAPMIARTETTPAYNFATITAWEQSGVVEGKEWLSSHDEAVRDAHRELDGQVVPIDGVFTVDGHSAEFPGGFGVPELDINCRCTTVAVLTSVAEATQEKLPRSIAERLSFREVWEKANKPSTNGHTKPSPELASFLASLVGGK